MRHVVSQVIRLTRDWAAVFEANPDRLDDYMTEFRDDVADMVVTLYKYQTLKE